MRSTECHGAALHRAFAQGCGSGCFAIHVGNREARKAAKAELMREMEGSAE